MNINTVIPRSTFFIMKSVSFFFENLKWFAAGLLLICLLLGASISRGIGLPIPERQDFLCQRLGYEPQCKFQWEKGKTIKGHLEIIIDDRLDEPGDEPDIENVRATTLHVTTQNRNGSLGANVFQTYQMLCLHMFPYLMEAITEPPCISNICVEEREKEWESGRTVNYSGVTEEDLALFDRVLEDLIYQTGDEEINAALRQAHDATGMPVIVRADGKGIQFFDHTEDTSATIFIVPIVIKFAMPGPNFAY